MLQQVNRNQFQGNTINATLNSIAQLCQYAKAVINKMLNILGRIKKQIKYLFVNKIILTFALHNTTYSYSTYNGTLIQDNTPSRLAAMQHTWEVFSFYTSTKYQNYHANV